VSETIRIGTRGSKLALWQANWMADSLRDRCPDLEVAIEIVKTTGDVVQDRPLAQIGVKGSFTKELDKALLESRVDVVVHSLKDMPTDLEKGILLAAVPERADARDVFIGKDPGRMADLPQGAVVGTGSLRRCAQLRALRPDLKVEDIRGNIDTRIRKSRESNTLAGILLAAAGVLRLELTDHITEFLEFEDWLPAPGQGALGVVVRDGNEMALKAASTLDHPETRAAVTAERALLARLEGGCHVPVGAYAQSLGDELMLDALIAHPDGEPLIRTQAECAFEDAAKVGEALADQLLSRGGDRILAVCEERK
jgi:hydroxymethylbilane synthase